jgi:hypothetical protein
MVNGEDKGRGILCGEDKEIQGGGRWEDGEWEKERRIRYVEAEEKG